MDPPRSWVPSRQAIHDHYISVFSLAEPEPTRGLEPNLPGPNRVHAVHIQVTGRSLPNRLTQVVCPGSVVHVRKGPSEGAVARLKHPEKDIEALLRSLELAGWRIEKAA
jgi:hypothetical protein